MKKIEVITRLAPTPSGFLHQGNLFNFMLNWLYARKCEGKVFLRIDDLDSERAKPEFVEAIFRDLEAMGMDWDFGPSGPDDFYKNWSQKHRTDRYVDLITTLSDKGFTYGCECSRKSLHEQGFSGEYPGICRTKSMNFKQNSTSLRFNREAFGFASGDPIILRKDSIPAYHIGSICDDVDYGVTHVFRGKDLEESTQLQKEMASAAAISEYDNILFKHHELILDSKGEKLSKSLGNAVGKQQGSLFKEFASWMGVDARDGQFQNMADLMALPLSII
jgi:glutamyl-tRNA synthetase